MTDIGFDIQSAGAPSDGRTFNLNSLVRENIKTLKPYSSARHEFTGKATFYWMPTKMHTVHRSKIILTGIPIHCNGS
jgi:hypothetical protein